MAETKRAAFSLPRPLEMDWVALEQRHVLRVRRGVEPLGFLFSA